MTPIDTAELERLAADMTPGPWAVDSEDQGAAWGTAYSVHVAGNILDEIADSVSSEANARAIALLPALLREVLAHRKAEDWRPETNILPWVALTIEQKRRFEATSGDLERLGLNGEWIPTDTPLSPGLVYRIKPTPTTEVSHDE